MTTPAIDIREITRSFGEKRALDRLTFQVEAGEVFGLLGRNGAGKSTLIKILTTLLPPSSGDARVMGFDVLRQPGKVRRHIGYVPQALSADGELTGYENLLIFAKLYDLPSANRDERIRASLAFMGLEAVADHLVKTYSGGMIRALEIAQSTLHQPEVLFLDEPTVGLDPLARNSVLQRIEQLREEYGSTVLITTHLMEEAERLCTRVAILRHGRIVAIGTPQALCESVGPGANLEAVFEHYTQGDNEEAAAYDETSRTRRTAQRVG